MKKRLPLLLPMGIAELCVFFVCVPLAIFRPRSALLDKLMDWIHGLPDFGWYIGKKSNAPMTGGERRHHDYE
ncbi:MAG TPA: hypothetical protein P5125_07795 [Kiritimatiellia bacterium]|nr:hypothetical protein [Kiritimatiellia bacterium]